MNIFKLFVIFSFIISIKNSSAIHKHSRDWWQTSVFYQIYPRSFHDSNGDGIGDLSGITAKLEYLKNLGIGAIWMSPIFKSPMRDFGYDISDYREIQEEYGTMEDFNEMITVAHRLGIKIIMDFVPNHTSNEHEWFKKSIKREEPYTDYYVWEDGIPNTKAGEKNLPPNNWLARFRDSAWEWNEERQQYYLHQFLVEQPDLNFRNPDVLKEMKDILIFWLDKGIDGFRVDAVIFLIEDAKLRDEPLSHTTTDPGDYAYLQHIYTNDDPESLDIVYEWRELLDNYKSNISNSTRILMVEAYTDIKLLMKYYQNEDGTKMGAHIPFNFLLITDLDSKSTAHDFVHSINKWLDYKPILQTSNWVVSIIKIYINHFILK